jgi:hypothetical protein
MMFLTLGKIKSDGLKNKKKYQRKKVTKIFYNNFRSLVYDVILVLLVVFSEVNLIFFLLLTALLRFPSNLITWSFLDIFKIILQS